MDTYTAICMFSLFKSMTYGQKKIQKKMTGVSPSKNYEQHFKSSSQVLTNIGYRERTRHRLAILGNKRAKKVGSLTGFSYGSGYKKMEGTCCT